MRLDYSLDREAVNRCARIGVTLGLLLDVGLVCTARPLCKSGVEEVVVESPFQTPKSGANVPFVEPKNPPVVRYIYDGNLGQALYNQP